MAGKVAKTVRVITIPPMLVFALLTILLGNFGEFYRGFADYLAALTFLMIIPTLAYPVQMMVPAWKVQGRPFQRKLAFVFSVTGYTMGLALALLSKVEPKLLSIYVGYFTSVIFLTIFNKGLKIHASGHAAGITGPLLYLAVYSEIWMVPIAAILYVAIIWSSLKIKRHTASEFLLGTLCSVAAFIVSMLVASLI